MQESVLHKLSQVQIPVLLLAGTLDAKYGELARRMAAMLPDKQLVTVPKSGHAIHLEQPAVFASTVRLFLEHCRQNQSKKESLKCP